MIKFLKNFLKLKNNTFKNKNNFRELVSDQDIVKLFKAFNNFSNDTELRFVGGCIRKLISDEKVEDIDLSTNLKPENIVEILKKNKL